MAWGLGPLPKLFWRGLLISLDTFPPFRYTVSHGQNGQTKEAGSGPAEQVDCAASEANRAPQA